MVGQRVRGRRPRVHKATIYYRIVDRVLFEQAGYYGDYAQSDPEKLLEALLSGKSPLECGIEIVSTK